MERRDRDRMLRERLAGVWRRLLDRLVRPWRPRRSATGLVEIAGRHYAAFHPDYGNHAEELFFHTSRYYAQTEAFLASHSGRADFRLGGYRAHDLSLAQRRVLAALLAEPLSRDNAALICAMVDAVRRGDPDVGSDVPARLLAEPHAPIAQAVHDYHRGTGDFGAAPVRPDEPFRNLARRLGIPFRARGRVIRTSFPALARQLDSRNPTIRRNLKAAILRLHRGGYRLRRSRGSTDKP